MCVALLGLDPPGQQWGLIRVKVEMTEYYLFSTIALPSEI